MCKSETPGRTGCSLPAHRSNGASDGARHETAAREARAVARRHLEIGATANVARQSAVRCSMSDIAGQPSRTSSRTARRRARDRQWGRRAGAPRHRHRPPKLALRRLGRGAERAVIESAVLHGHEPWAYLIKLAAVTTASPDGYRGAGRAAAYLFPRLNRGNDDSASLRGET